MENAVQALKTAAAVLIFVIAITTAFVMFSKAKTTADAVIIAQDKQKYLDSPEVSGGILYVSKEDIDAGKITKENDSGEKVPTMTKDGYRIVEFNDVISTIYRYSVEKYGVTIVDTNGNIIARFDSSTESNIITSWNNLTENQKKFYTNQWEKNTKNNIITPKFEGAIERIYKSKNHAGKENIDAKWYTEDSINNNYQNSYIIKHINALIEGKEFEFNNQTYNYNPKIKLSDYKNNSFIEIVNTIDTSKYLEDKDENDKTIKTELQIQNDMPTIEIIYILQE